MIQSDQESRAALVSFSGLWHLPWLVRLWCDNILWPDQRRLSDRSVPHYCIFNVDYGLGFGHFLLCLPSYDQLRTSVFTMHVFQLVSNRLLSILDARVSEQIGDNWKNCSYNARDSLSITSLNWSIWLMCNSFYFLCNSFCILRLVWRNCSSFFNKSTVGPGLAPLLFYSKKWLIT